MAPTNEDVPQIFETNLKDLLKYLVKIKDKFPYDDVSINWEAGDGEGGEGGLVINRIPWTDNETELHKRRMRFFAKVLGEKMDRLALENRSVVKTVEKIKTLISSSVNGAFGGNDINRINELIEHVSALLKVVQPVDIEKLIKLMKKNQASGEAMAGKDVILLCGASKSGKTTTLHHLAGTSFEAVEAGGCPHLQPKSYVDPAVAEYKTASCDEKAETRCLQTATIKMNGVDVVICDSPGFDESETTEEKIANGLGIVRAIHKAKTVRPVLLINRERIGHRFAGFKDTIASVTRLLGCEKMDWRPFNYAFSNYQETHRASLCRQFILVKKNPPDEEKSKISFLRMIDDLVQKTSPEANIVLPLDGSPILLFRSFLNDTPVITDAKRYFVPFVPETCLEKLKTQLQVTLRDVMTALVDEDYVTVFFRMRQLNKLASVLPEAGDCARLAFEAAARHVTMTRERVVKSIENIKNVKVHKQFTQLVLTLKSHLDSVLRSENLRIACGNYEQRPSDGSSQTLFDVCKPKAGTSENFCNEQVQELTKHLSKDIPQFKPGQSSNTEILMRNRGSILTAVVRLKEVSEILRDNPVGARAATLYKMVFAQFYAFVDCALSEAEDNFDNTADDIQSFERQAWFLAVLIQGFLNKPDTGGGEHSKMQNLEKRRLKLMLRLEMNISDTLELVSSTQFPSCDIDDLATSRSYFLPLVKLSGLRKPRNLLVSVTEIPRLCKFLPGKMDPQLVVKAIDMLDRSIVVFLAKLVLKAEAVNSHVNDLIDKDEDPTKVLRVAEKLSNDLLQVGTEFANVRGWSKNLAAETTELWTRLATVKDSVDERTTALEETIAQRSTFSCGTFPSNYWWRS